jgi:hypothetical protein
VQVFPLPVLGMLLFFEGLALAVLVRDVTPVKADLAIAVLTGLLCIGLPYGYLYGLLAGTTVYYLSKGHTDCLRKVKGKILLPERH